MGKVCCKSHHDVTVGLVRENLELYRGPFAPKFAIITRQRTGQAFSPIGVPFSLSEIGGNKIVSSGTLCLAFFFMGTVLNRVQKILSLRTIAEVFRTVVSDIAVWIVANLLTFRTWAMECQSHSLMNLELILKAIFTKDYLKTTTLQFPGLQDTPLNLSTGDIYTIERSNPAIRTGVINPLETQNGSPLFHRNKSTRVRSGLPGGL